MNTAVQSHDTLSAAPDEFARIQQLIYKHTAIVITEAKQDFIRARISRRMRELGLRSINEYCESVESGDEPQGTFISLVTTNHTHFMRERHHFERLVSHFSQIGIENRNIWSSACSSGEEPYSIVISLAEVFSNLFESNLKVLASDLDQAILAKAETGIYPPSRIEPLSDTQISQCCVKGVGEQQGLIRVKKQLRDLIEFKSVNLIEPFNINTHFDVIFCRNVGIYFDRETKIKLFDQFAQLQQPGDLMFIGHSESLNDISRAYEPLGDTAYRRV